MPTMRYREALNQALREEMERDEDVFLKLRGDFDAKGVSISDAELRAKMSEFLAEAVKQLEIPK